MWSATPATHGTVKGIYAVSCQYAPSAGSPGLFAPVPGSGVLSRVVQAHRFGHHHYGGQPPRFSAEGWVSDFKVC